MESSKERQHWRQYSDEVFSRMEEYLWDMECEQGLPAKECIEQSYEFAYTHLSKELRKNGKSYFEHAHNSVLLLLDVRPSLHTVQLCILHDIPKFVQDWKELVADTFGEKSVERIVKFSSIQRVHDSSNSNDDIATLREMLLVLADDIEVIMVKLATRLDSVSSMERMPKQKQLKIAREVLYIFAPIASRMGLYGLKIKLEDEAFKVLWPKTYHRIESERRALIKRHSTLLDEAKKKLSQIMLDHGISGSIYHRIKSVYSIANKLQKKGLMHVAEIHDFFAFRFLLNSKDECYKLLGYIHHYFPPVPGRIKDYIAAPKRNNYMSLHTTILGLYDKNPTRSVEVQIRTKEMDDIAEYGIASHTSYKEGVAIDGRVKWQDKLADFSRSFSEMGQVDTLTDKHTKGFQEIFEKIYVLTPTGKITTLPKGATALDFAYSVHTDIGHTCVAAKVNGEVAPLDSILHSGDAVEIVTRRGQTPSASSLLYVKTSNARNKIRQYFRSNDQEQIAKNGRSVLERYLKSKKPQYTVDDFLLRYMQKRSGIHTPQSILVEVGKGDLLPRDMYRVVVGVRKKTKKKRLRAQKRKLIIAGSPYMPFTIAGCCQGKIDSLPGDKLIAYLNIKHEIRVHRKCCPHLGKDPKRMLEVAT